MTTKNILQSLTIRRAEEDDLAAIVALLADDDLGVTREDVRQPLNSCYSVAFDAITRDPNQYLAVAANENVIIGCLQLTMIPGLSRMGMLRGQIESVRTARSCRGAGVGKALFQWAIDRCRSLGCGLVQLTTDKTRTGAHGFYASLGFNATHEGMKLIIKQ